MKSTLIIVILAAACAAGLYTQYTGKEKQIAAANDRKKAANAEADRLRPALDKAQARFDERKKTLDDTSANMPEKELAAALKTEAAKVEEAKASLATEQARPVPDPPMPAAQAADLEAIAKEIAASKEKAAKIDAANVTLRRYRSAEEEVMPKGRKK